MLPQIILHENNYQIIEIGDQRYYFSYMTCVAFANFKENIRIRRESNFSKTTAKHMTFMGVKDWTAVKDEEFERLATLVPARRP